MKYFFLIACLFFTTAALAATPYGLAMHGAPKYTAEGAHLDYANPDAPKGGHITYGAIGTFDTLNPYSIKGKAAQGLNLTYDRLMARVWDEAFTMYPLIAERVEVAEDRSTITFFINPKARFHDGTPITAEDVLFSFHTLKESGRPNMRRIYQLVENAEIIDNGTAVHFTLGEGYDQETVMILALMPVLSKAYWEGKTFDATTLDIPNSSGPYRIAKIDAGRSITYERDPNYWAKDHLTRVGHYNYDTITYDYYRDDTVAFEAFKSGDIDLRREWDAGKWASSYHDLPAVKAGEIITEAIPHGRPERVRSFIYNTRRAPFDDIRVREALSLLFDFEWANKNLFHGRYKRIDSHFPNSELAAPLENTEPKTYRENLRKANALLNDAGWIVENGLRMKDGQAFSFEILLGAPEDEKLALHFKRSLEKMGIAANLRVMDSAAYRARLNEYDFDMTLYFWLSTLSPGTEQMLYWSCESANTPARWNFAGICKPEIDETAASIAEAKTREELLSRTQKLDQLLLQGHYMIPLTYAGEDYVAYWSKLQHPDTTPLYGAVLETWWEKPVQEMVDE